MPGKLIPFIVVLVLCSTAVADAQTSPSSALRFTADGQFVLVPNSEALDNIAGELTIEAWVKPEAGILARGYDSILSKQMSGTGYMLATNIASPEERFKAEVAGLQATSASQPAMNAWQHVAAVWDGQLKIYVNGQLDGVIDAGHPIPNSFPLWIGSSPFGADTNWRGAIDEVRIWGVARSQSEIQATMSHSPCGHEPGLRAYWSFDEGEGQVLHDTVGQNDGQINGPVWVPGVELVRPSCAPVEGVGGSVTGLRPALIVCRNVTTGRRVVIQEHEMLWNCETAGLEVTSGDVMLINILGGAN